MQVETFCGGWIKLPAEVSLSTQKGDGMGLWSHCGGMMGRAGSFLRSGEAAGYPKGIFVRKSDLLSLEQLTNVFLCMSR